MNLTTSYLGLTLENPLVIGSSPLADSVTYARQLQDAGAAAIVLRSLFEEQLAPAARFESFNSGYTPVPFDGPSYPFSPDQYLRQVSRLKRELAIPVIASLNAGHAGSWVSFARQLESAGADALELNFYRVVADPHLAADQVELEMLEAVNAITSAVSMPVAVKLSPFHAAVAQLALALELAGAAGVVVFNRFYQPDINVEDLAVEPVLRLSEPGELLLRLRWLAILSPLLPGSLAVTGGVHTAEGVVKSLLAGAHAVQIVSAVLEHGPEVVTRLREGLLRWMRLRGCETIDEFRGRLNQERCDDPATYERANYIRVLQSWRR